jgi:cell wall-associated NlpC family hydrolase
MHWVNKYIGIPYADKGRSFNGTDCWGLVYLVLLKEFGIRVPTYTEDYSSSNKQCRDQIQDLVKQERRMWQPVELGKEQPGDVINLRVMAKDWHTGIVVGNNEMLHTLAGHESVCESYLSRMWKDRIAGIYRHERLAS